MKSIPQPDNPFGAINLELFSVSIIAFKGYVSGYLDPFFNNWLAHEPK